MAEVSDRLPMTSGFVYISVSFHTFVRASTSHCGHFHAIQHPALGQAEMSVMFSDRREYEVSLDVNLMKKSKLRTDGDDRVAVLVVLYNMLCSPRIVVDFNP